MISFQKFLLMRSSSLHLRWDPGPTPTRRSTAGPTAASPCSTMTHGQERLRLAQSKVPRCGQQRPGRSDSSTPWRGRPAGTGDTGTLASWTPCSWSRLSRTGLMTASTVWTWRSRSCSTVSRRLRTSSMIIRTPKVSGSSSYIDLRAIENISVIPCLHQRQLFNVSASNGSFMFEKYCHKIFSFWSSCKCIGARVKTASSPRMIKCLIYWDRGFHILQQRLFSMIANIGPAIATDQPQLEKCNSNNLNISQES